MSDYEDDFENYDDDEFENGEEDYEVLPKHMTKPSTPPTQPKNEQLQTSPLGRQPSFQGRPPSGGYGQQRPPSAQRPLDIPAAPQLSDAEMRAQRKRLAAARQKMKHVQLEVVAMDDLFVMQPLTQYDLYCMARGVYSNAKVAAVQTNEDAKEEEAQTEEIPSRSYASQVPDDRNKMTDAEVYAFTQEARTGRASSASASASSAGPPAAAEARVLNMEAGLEVKLASFMQWAGPVMLAALGMSPSGASMSFGADPKGGQGLAAGLMHLGWEELLAHRPVTSLAFSPVASDPHLLVAYGPVGAQLGAAELIKDHTLATKGCLCVWDLGNPSRPKHVLISEGAPSCCAVGPSPGQNLMFAGMEEGGVCCWDVDEPAGRHPVEVVGGETIAARRPSYTTEGAPDPAGAGPIVGIAAVAKEGGGRSAPCSIVALTAWGEVRVYTASLLAGAEGSAADIDLGMRIGSRVRLLRNAGGVRLGAQALAPAGSPQEPLPTHSLAILTGPKERGQVLVGSEGGRVLRGSWVGTPPAPKVFIADDFKSPAAISSQAATLLSTSVTCLATSPFLPKAFLAGHNSGTLALHSTDMAAALLLWPELGTGALQALAWSPTRPAVFFALDAACTVHCFDLTKNLSGPIHTEPFMAQGPGGVASLSTCLSASALQPGGKATAPIPCCALGYDDGGVDVLPLAHRFAQGSGSAEVALLQEILGVVVTADAAAVADQGVNEYDEE